MKRQWKIKSFVGILCLMAGLLNVAPAYSVEDPVQLLRGVTSRVIAELKSHREEIKRNRSKVYGLVEHLILPYVDFAEMARWVVGRNVWNQTDPGTKQEFVREFRNLVVSSYAGSLLGYSDQEVVFLPLRGSAENQDRIQVNSLIKDGGKAPLHLDYRLIRQENSWKVYDIIIEGVSLAQGYRAQFADDVRVGGVPQAIRAIKNKRR
jgi:phospholipid transport system substrate-binding protein